MKSQSKMAPQKGKKPVWIWLILGTFALLILAGIYFFVIPNIAGMSVDPAVFAAVCQGQGVSNAASYAGGPGPHPILFLQEGKRVSNIGAPKGWPATSAENTELVACVGRSEKYVLETCHYAGAPEIKRYGYKQAIQLFAAQTGELIAADTVHGGAPRACKQVEERSVKSLTGDQVNLWDWLEKYVEPVALSAFGEPGVSEDGFEITVLDVNWDAWEQIKAVSDVARITPQPGKPYVMVTVRIRNTRKDPDIHGSDFILENQFRIQSGSNYYPEAHLFSLLHTESFLEPQTEITGTLAFQLPKSALDENLQLVYRDGAVVLSLK
jgi:hypothetical protein